MTFPFRSSMTRSNDSSSTSDPETTDRSNGTHPFRLALLGNPNTGKTSVFNSLCGLRAKTSNIPGTTVESRTGRFKLQSSNGDHREVELIDLPGLYRLAMDLPEAHLCRLVLAGSETNPERPDGVIIVVDAANLSRNLRLVVEVLEHGLPVIVALNMIDIAQRAGLSIDAKKLSEHLGCPVVSICARSGQGVDELRQTIESNLTTSADVDQSESEHPDRPTSEDLSALAIWSDRIVQDSVGGADAIGRETDTLTDRLDATFTHPMLGVIFFILIMGLLFTSLFWLAQFPMGWIEILFGSAETIVSTTIPKGWIHDLLVEGVIAGIGGIVVFLPQICLLFFLISLLEDTGYLARAAFVMDRIMCRFGLPGQAFVPLLSSHACALPGIMATKLIPDRKDRLATILVAPFMSCSARVPVYALLTGLLFRHSPLLAGLTFFGCYVLGAIVALGTAFVFRRTLLPGRARPMVLELPTYKLPSLTNAILTTLDRAFVFLKTAGTIILTISIILWWMETFPTTPPPPEAIALYEQADEISLSDPDQADILIAEADQLTAIAKKSNSYAARIGKTIEPVFRPVGYDWQLTVGVLTSFAAREVFVSTMAVLVGGDEDDETGLIESIQTAKRQDGSPVFTTATSAGLLVFYVLAMQCLPTLAVTKRETGTWKWPIVQLVYATSIAYGLAFVTFQGLTILGL